MLQRELATWGIACTVLALVNDLLAPYSLRSVQPTRREIMSAFERLTQLRNDKAKANLDAGLTYLSVNKNAEGVVETASGLQYTVLTLGTGEKPTARNTVTCHYHGTTIDGAVFDSSVQRGVPASFPLGAVIKGWTEGLQYMPTGSTFRFFIPPDLAYGDREVSALIGANSTLIFDVELISFA